MAILLNIETATTVCSVSLSENGRLMAVKELDAGYTHAENLHVFIEAILKETNITPSQLEAVAVSQGPGSYTGLRIGASAAKGFAWALKIPLVAVDTLQLMAFAAKEQTGGPAKFWPMIDARRMEVYTALYDEQLKPLSEVKPLIADQVSLSEYAGSDRIYCFGNGMPKLKPLLTALPNVICLENIIPSARYMPAPAHSKLEAGQTEDVAYFEPLYLKEFQIKTKQK